MHLRVICRSARLSGSDLNGIARVYMCLCNALTDKTLKQAAEAIGSVKASQVYAACGCRLQCGQCVRAVIDMLRNHTGQLQGAD